MTVDLAAVQRRYTETYREHQGHAWARGWPCCSAHGVADDVPALIAALESAREERDRLAETVARVRRATDEWSGHHGSRLLAAVLAALDVPSGEQTDGEET